MAEHLSDMSLGNVSVVMEAFEKRTEDALIRLVTTLPPDKGTELLNALGTAAEEADAHRKSLFKDEIAQPPLSLQPRQGRPQRVGGSLLPLDEDEDFEHPAASTPTHGLGIQKIILEFVDDHAWRELMQRHDAEQNRPATRRLLGLAH